MIVVSDKYGIEQLRITAPEELWAANTAMNDARCPLRDCGGSVHLSDSEQDYGHRCWRCGHIFVTLPGDEVPEDQAGPLELVWPGAL